PGSGLTCGQNSRYVTSQSRRQAGITGTKPREAYGVRGACSRFRTAPHIRQREQAPRTPYASRDTTALVIRLCNLLRIPRKSAQKNKIFAYIIQRAARRNRSQPGALRIPRGGTPYPPPPLLDTGSHTGLIANMRYSRKSDEQIIFQRTPVAGRIPAATVRVSAAAFAECPGAGGASGKRRRAGASRTKS